ncbi:MULTISPECIES: hypothetical protein [Bacillus cereus group]|uniref:Uncharacterized protein n=1 Tax=Bacillus cereus TaxID=1396 RepID=A0A9W7UXL8_BACCE|nr:hypothetical protein [Bacillus cereus]KAB2397742.1 hypothetical protein F8172_09830 [Bacillus cereus]KAB2405910.1 hypothetical protein F8170_14270 [Bacillus cereus]KAB2432009.1 hypothetical protein F8168_01645 [Bacillus cereus]
MAFLTNFKAKGRRYFYIEKYVGGKPIDCRQSERVYSIGNERIALERLSLWILDNSFIPNEVIKLGISIDDIENWREKVENTIKKYSL